MQDECMPCNRKAKMIKEKEQDNNFAIMTEIDYDHDDVLLFPNDKINN